MLENIVNGFKDGYRGRPMPDDPSFGYFMSHIAGEWPRAYVEPFVFVKKIIIEKYKKKISENSATKN